MTAFGYDKKFFIEFQENIFIIFDYNYKSDKIYELTFDDYNY